MAEALASTFWNAALVYAGVGGVFAVWLFAWGLSRLDANAAAAPIHVKALLTPGVVALWPLLLRRVAGARPPEDRA